MDTGPEDRGVLDAALVERVRSGDPDAFGELYDRWFDRVHDVAFRVTHDSGAAADVAQDAFLAAWQQLPKLERPEVFGGWLLRITRNRALDHVRRRARSVPGDPETMAMIERTTTPTPAAPAGFRVEDRVATADDPERAAEDDEIAELVWGAATALGARDGEVLDLLRHGLTPAEIGDVVGTNRNAANQMVHRARAHLKDAVCARVLWRRGHPECGDLADALAAAGIDGFGADAVRVTTAHAETCDLCTRRRALRLDPSRIFVAVPLVGAPVALKQRTAHALMADGVPLGRSEAVGGAGPPVGGRRAGRGARRAAVIAGAAVVTLLVVLTAVVVLADRLDHGTVEGDVVARSRPAGTTTTRAPTTSTTTATVPAVTGPTAAPPAVAPPPAGPEGSLPPADDPAPPPADPDGDEPEPPEPPGPGGSVTASIGPATAPPTWLRPEAPVLQWSSDGAATVEVSGPGVSASGVSGSTPVCPQPSGPQWSFCAVPPGTYTYTATARDAAGAVLAVATTSLTVG